MKPTFLIVAAAAVLAAGPATAQPSNGAVALSPRETVPLRVRDDQVAAMQQKLDDQGFDAGQVDGLWGPNTSAALRRYQATNGLPPSGQLDPKTLAALSIVSTAAATPVPQVQAPSPSVSAAAPPSVAVPPATFSPVMQRANSGVASASGNNNQAVATTSVNAPQPAKGANSFTAAEARGRIERQGYAQVADLEKDCGGVWRGHATKDGASLSVWLDYKGNVGQQ